ncbi:MAG: hypothetical protein IJ568_06960 [Bacilli bacterium]|nr:hypothetical protein [Bacilli bacterium]
MNIKNINVKRLASLALMGFVLSSSQSNRAVFDNFSATAYAETIYQDVPNCIKVEKNVNVRKGPSKQDELYGITLPENLVIEEYGHVDGWYKIKIGNSDCYVNEDYVSPCKRYDIGNEVVVSDTDNLNIRALPSSDNRVSPSLGRLDNHESLKLLYTMDDWYAVSYRTRDERTVTAFLSRDYTHLETEVQFIDLSTYKEEKKIAEGVVTGDNTLACSDNKLSAVFGIIPKGTQISVSRIGQDYLLVSYDEVVDKTLNTTNHLNCYIKREDANITKVLEQGLRK